MTTFADIERENIRRCKAYRPHIECGTDNPGSTPLPAPAPAAPRRPRGGRLVREKREAARHLANMGEFGTVPLTAPIECLLDL